MKWAMSPVLIKVVVLQAINYAGFKEAQKHVTDGNARIHFLLEDGASLHQSDARANESP
jgi:hypothetical protein